MLNSPAQENVNEILGSYRSRKLFMSFNINLYFIFSNKDFINNPLFIQDHNQKPNYFATLEQSCF
jgi:hypothetical protein